ncbi:putative FBD-associated F-box protein [Arabidopsis thaliana]
MCSFLERKQLVGRELNQGSKADMISQLPDPLICHILSHLPIKDLVTTRVLSTRWRSLWLWLPCLELNSLYFPDFNAFVSFGDKFFDSNRVSCINKFKLYIYGYDVGVDDPSYLTSWIDAAVKCKIQHLHVQCLPAKYIYEMPLSLYICETLVYLKLCRVMLDDAEFVSLPCLKTIHLEYVWFPNEANLERFVSCCPVLEELKIYGCGNENAITLRLLSRSLKKLSINILKSMCDFHSEVVIDAPLLSYLKINDNVSERYIVNNLESNAKLDISLPFGLLDFDEASVSSRTDSIHSFLRGILKVSDMTIWVDTFKLICKYSELESLPRFGYMSRLHVTLCIYDLKWLPTFLESCPNLKSLILVCVGDNDEMLSEEMIQFGSSLVPECLLSSLEFVDIRIPFRGHLEVMKLVRYFLENSAILKKLSLDHDIFKKLFTIPRRSTKCQVVFI